MIILFSDDLKDVFKIFFCFLAVLTMFFAIVFFATRIEEIAIDTKQYCPSCGYDLTGRIPHRN